MGERGRTPTPTALRILKGDKESRINRDEPKPAPGIPDVPPTVEDVDVLKVWAYTCAQLKKMGCVAPVDRDVLHAYCEAVVLHRRASQYVAEHGITAIGAMGTVTKNPMIQVQRDAANTMARLGRLFGLTPSARSEIRMGSKTDQSSAERFLSA